MKTKHSAAISKKYTYLEGEINDSVNGTMVMYDSLLLAVDEAGGANGSYCWERLKKMTVADLLARLGPNNIIFAYMGK